jgi:hypothetical protein
VSKNLNLKNVTLVAMTSVLIDETIKALMYSSDNIDFGAVKLISSIEPKNLPSRIKFEYTEPINNIDTWNHRIVYHLTDHIDTEFAILIHDDGFIVNTDSWRPEFLEYDYIGGAWDHKHFIDRYGKQIRVGNSVSLRSKKLLDIPKKFNMPWIKYDNNYNEDTQICVWNRNLFLDNGVNFADFDVAKYFSHETIFKEYNGIEPFCFHNFGGENIKYKKIIDSYKIN